MLTPRRVIADAGKVGHAEFVVPEAGHMQRSRRWYCATVPASPACRPSGGLPQYSCSCSSLSRFMSGNLVPVGALLMQSSRRSQPYKLPHAKPPT